MARNGIKGSFLSDYRTRPVSDNVFAFRVSFSRNVMVHDFLDYLHLLLLSQNRSSEGRYLRWKKITIRYIEIDFSEDVQFINRIESISTNAGANAFVVT